MVDLAGQHIGNYRLIERIASGGMADIYLARHTYLERQVAVKILQAGISEPGQMAFLQEARIIASLKHPNIIPIHDFGIHTGGDRPFAYLVMEYAFGSLADRHPPGTLVPFETVRSYVSAIASALYHAHNQNIVHRDVKPSNVLIGENDNILLSDFGIATLTGTDEDHVITGTPAYMAPEQVTGSRITFAADQYALGIVVYQWLCGFPPFMGDNTTDLIIQQVQSTPPPLRSRIPSIPAEVEEIVLKALAKKPEERFLSVKAFADSLDEPLRLAALTQPLQDVPLNTSPYSTQPGAYSQTPVNPWIQPPGYATGNQYPDSGGWEQPPYYKGPPTITGYAPPAYNNAVAGMYLPESANVYPYTPPPPAPSSARHNPLLILLSLLVAPFVLIGRLIPQANSRRTVSPYSNTNRFFPGFASTSSALKNFFIMYHSEDRLWAEWIAWHLEEAGYSAILPDWDFHAGSNFDLEMTRASVSADQVIIVLSPTYLSTAENLRTLRRVLSSKRDTVVPIVVHEYDKTFKHPLRDLVALNLVNLSRETAQARLLSAVRKERQKPLVQPVFPPELMTQSQLNIPANPLVPVQTTQANVVPGTAAFVSPISPLPQPLPQFNTQQAQGMNNFIFNVNTIVSNARDIATVLASQNPNFATTAQSDATVRRTPGDNQVTIEQKALKVAAFLKSMREQVIANPEFGKHYSDAGRMDNLFATLATNLTLNFQRLEEAREKAAMNPSRRQYQDDIDNYLEGLANTSDRIEQTWQEFRADAQTQLEDLQQKVEIESEQEELEETERTQKLGESTEDTRIAERKNWLKTALNGLGQFKDFLLIATDIDKAVTQWSPTIMEAAKQAFSVLGQLHF